MSKEIREDLRFNIERANEIVRLYENRQKIFLELNLALMTAYSLVLGVLFQFFNLCGKISISIAICVYFGFTLWNVKFNLKENKTLDTIETICFKGYEGDYSNFEDDYKNQIKNLHKYQQNYDKIAKKSRDITRKGLYVLIIGLGLSIIINMMGIFFQIP